MTAFVAALVVAGRRCLVLGGDREALEKSRRLSAAGAIVTVVAAEVLPEIEADAARGAVRLERREFDPATDLAPPPFVIVSARIDDAFSAQLHDLARGVGAVLCCVDQPARCDFFHTAQGDAGGLTLAVATDGRAPSVARRLRDDLVAGLDGPLRALVAAVVALRAATPPEARRRRMAEALEGFGVTVTVRLPPWLATRD